MADFGQEDSVELERDFSNRLAKRDPSVVREIHVAYAGKLRRFISRRIGPWFTAEDCNDVIQETFLALCRDWVPPPKPSAWSVRRFLRTIARRKAADVLRRNSVRAQMQSLIDAIDQSEGLAEHEQPLDQLIRVESEGDRRALIHRIQRFVQLNLTPLQREVLVYWLKSSRQFRWAEDMSRVTTRSAQALRDAKREALKKLIIEFGDRHVGTIQNGECDAHESKRSSA